MKKILALTLILLVPFTSFAKGPATGSKLIFETSCWSFGKNVAEADVPVQSVRAFKVATEEKSANPLLELKLKEKFATVLTFDAGVGAGGSENVVKRLMNFGATQEFILAPKYGSQDPAHTYVIDIKNQLTYECDPCPVCNGGVSLGN